MKRKNQKQFKQDYMTGMNKRGVTLIEMLVVVGLFSIVGLIISSIFITNFRLQKRTVGVQRTLGEISYAIEYMSRSIRMARSDHDGACLGEHREGLTYGESSEGKGGIKYTDYKGRCLEFFLDEDGDEEVIKMKSEGEVYRLTSGRVDVTGFESEFRLTEIEDRYKKQPGVTFSLELEDVLTEWWSNNIQTSVTRRRLDVERIHDIEEEEEEEEEIETYNLTISTEGEGEEGNYGTGIYQFEAGLEINLEAIPESGWDFIEWTGYMDSSEEEIFFEMPTQDIEVTANFEEEEEDTYELTMEASPSEGGIATDQTDNSPYTEGTVVDISTQPEDGYEFINWSAPEGTFGDDSDPDTTFTMPDRDVTVTANFEEGWPDSDGYIYDEGDYEDEWVPGREDGNGNISKESDHLWLEIDGTFFHYDIRAWATDNGVDLTDYNTAYVDWEMAQNAPTGHVAFQATTEEDADKGEYWHEEDVRIENPDFNRQTNSFDISHLSGEWWFKAIIWETGGFNNSGGALRVYRVWLE